MIGIPRIALLVSPEGVVTNVTIKETPDAALGSCVAQAMQAAKFDRTEHGGSFSLPFVF